MQIPLNTILQGTVTWEDNIKEWTGLEFAASQRAAENRGRWRELVAESTLVPQRPPGLRDMLGEVRPLNLEP